MQREPVAKAAAQFALGHFRQLHELRIEQGQQVVKRRVVARMRRGREEDHPAKRLAFGQTLEKLVALVAGARVRPHAGVGLVHDDELRAGPQEVAAPAVGLDVVE